MARARIKFENLWRGTLEFESPARQGNAMVKFLLWCILLVICWPLALVFYPLVWLLLLPFRPVGITVTGALELVGGIIRLPGRLLRAVSEAV